MLLKPWMVVNERGYVLCLMCPCDKTNRRGDNYYLGVNPNKASRKKVVRWMREHRRCGFDGLRG